MTDSLDEMLTGIVKPLQFEGTDKGRLHFAYTPLADCYDVRLDNDGTWWVEAGRSSVGGNFTSSGLAKEFAQNHYRSRIISALNPHILLGMREAAREDALNQFAREYHEAYGCDPVAMANGRANWRKSAETRADALKRCLSLIDDVLIGDDRDDALAQMIDLINATLSPKDTSNGE